MELNQDLLNKLFSLRTQLKEKEKKETGRTPVICNDDALYDIAKYQPRYPNEFESIPGLGKAFVEKYGQSFANVVISSADKGFITKMSGDVSKTLKELEKNLITLNRRNRLLFSGQLRTKDGFDLSTEDKEIPIQFLFGKKQKIIIKNDENLKTLLLDDDNAPKQKSLSHYKKVTALLREVNRDLREKGQNNLYIAYPFVKGRMAEEFNIRAPLAFFPVKAEKNSLQISIMQDNSRDVIFNNALVLANYKFNKIKKPLPNPAIENDIHSPDELFTQIIDFYRENEMILKVDPLYHNEKAISLENDYSINLFESFKHEEFPVFKKGEYIIEDSMILGRFLICDSTIQRDFDELIERKESTAQLDKLLKSFSQLQQEAALEPEPKKQTISKKYSEADLTYINSLNSSQEKVLTSMNNMDQLVIQGPPGTGKSQTITSLISDYILKNKTVLLVSEKKTALDVVYSRLGTLSKYALLIDDVGNKADFYKQIQGMVSTASETSEDFVNLNEFSDSIETDVTKLKQISEDVFGKEIIGTPAYNLYQNSSKIDLSDFNSSKILLNIEEKYKNDLLKLKFQQLCEQKKLFADADVCKNLNYFISTKEKTPALLYVKSELSELEVSKLRFNIEKHEAEIEQLSNKSLFAKIIASSKIKKDIKKNVGTFISSSKFYRALYQNAVKTKNALEEYKYFQETKNQYEDLSKISKSYLSAIKLIKTENLDYVQTNDALFNIILNIHLSKFEAENQLSISYIEKYRDIIKHIASSMTDKRKGTITNSSLLLANSMKELTESKRKNEILRALESSRKPTVTKFLTKFKIEVFDSIKIWMLTPEVVSELIPLQQGIFDLVIFDEASQMFVERGIPSIFRAKKLVIAGDSKQLRPTRLFSGRFEEDPEEMEEDEETSEALEEQSLLDLARYKYDNVMLKYHYRSKYEELIAFSNHAFYKGQLLVSPNATTGENPPIQVHKIENGTWINTANKREAQYCVRLVKKILAERQNNETIGIITFNSHQHDMIEDCLDIECIRDKDFEASLAKERNRTENGEDISLFVKNIENVQGDERDIIIFSVGFAKNEDGKIYRNYGWLNNEGGENRLNVAISRAKSKIHIVTSVNPSELIVDDLKHEGPKLLKKYLEYCFAVDSEDKEKTKFILSNLSNKLEKDEEANQFTNYKNSVCDVLKKQGFIVEQNVGIGGYTIDIAIKRGKDYVLGIECDSSLYSTNSDSRERDFHRQRFLESRGWTVYRLWSQMWWQNQSKVIETIKQLID